MSPRDLRLGVDVGGTHTDAVVLDGDDQLLTKTKVLTSDDVISGIDEAIRAVLAPVAESAPARVDPTRISHVMIGTTHATNAVLERRDLRRVAVVRIGSPSTDSIRPLYGWPADLRAAVSAGECLIRGGSELDGRDIVPLGVEELKRFLGGLGPDTDGVAVTSVFSPVNNEHELAAASVIRAELGQDIQISFSHEIGTLGLLERENATVLNVALVGAARAVTESLTQALELNGLSGAVVYFAQNDGTLMTLDHAMNFPVLTIGSGPANSIRGAAYLTGIKDAIVADVGGTSTDLGVLSKGFPRESTLGVRIGGIDTNFRMPDLVSLAVGGGSVIRDTPTGVQLGPDSVGFRLTNMALVFGGATPTLSDAAVAARRARFGDQPDASFTELLAGGLALADRAFAEGIDKVKTSREELPLIAVGGGSVLLPDRIEGVSEVLRPGHFDVANAIGAAIGTVSGQVDRVYQLDKKTRSEVIEEAVQEARNQAIRAGVDPKQIEVVDLEEIPLAYTTSPTVRIRVKAAGPLSPL
jgi:N-methylhydantoinase A/oxoprolinase/acetone carboxylase beta subunit